MICAYEECNNEFIPKTHNQKYCSDECCKIATNIKTKQKYYDEKARKNGVKRQCAGKNCTNMLSRYNPSKTCMECENKKINLQKKSLLEMIKNVSS